METVFHIGFPKSASTLLQHEFFAQHPEINSIGKPNHRTNQDVATLLDLLRFSDSTGFRYNRIAPQLFSELQDPERLDVLSCEDFSSATYWETKINKIGDRSSIAANLHSLAPQARILIVLREPVSCLKSIYAQLATNNKLPGFSTWIDEQLDRIGSGSILEMLVYRDLLRTYADLFGKENLIVLEFDAIVADAQNSFAETAEILGVARLERGHVSQANKRRTRFETTMRRAFSRNSVVKPIIQKTPQGVKKGLSRAMSIGNTLPTEFNPEQLAAVNQFFAPGIEALGSDWGVGQNWTEGGTGHLKETGTVSDAAGH